MFEDDGHLFLIPPVAHAVVNAEPKFSTDFSNNGAGLDGLETLRIIEAITPALRAVMLAGYRPWKIEFGLDANDRVELILGAEPRINLATSATDINMWSSGNAAFTVLIHTFPYHAVDYEREPTEPDFFSHAMAVPTPSGQWGAWGSSTPSSAVMWRDLPDLEWRIFQLSLLSIDPETGIAGGLSLGPAQDLINDFTPALASAFSMGTGTQGRGLVWLYNPDNWFGFPDDEDVQENLHQRVIKRIGGYALLETGSPNLEEFFRQQIAGDMKAEAVLYAATDRRRRSRSRARRFLKHIRKWAADDDAPLPPYPDNFDLAIETLGWTDLLFAMVESGFLIPGALPDTEKIVLGTDGSDEPITYEPLIAQKPSENVVELRVFGSDGNFDIEEDGSYDLYATVVRMTAFDMPVPDPSDIDASIGLRSIESMCAWEYVPANSENPKARLLIVAGPGVQIDEFESALVDVQILRKQDYGLPPWGAPLRAGEIFQPIVIPGVWPSTVTRPLNDDDEPAWIIQPRVDGVLIHLFSDLPGVSDGIDVAQITVSPDATIDVTLTDICSGTAGFRIECDFACLEEDAGYEGWSPRYREAVRPILRFWQTAEGVQTKVTHNWFTDFDGQFWEHTDLATLFANFPHAVPITVPARWQPPRVGDVYPNAIDSMEVRDPETLAIQMTVPIGDLQARGFIRIADDDPALLFEYEWTAIDWFLIPVDIALGFTPVGNVIDVVEFIYAWNTGKDKWGRPVTEMDLWMMGIGAAVPIAGSAVFRSSADVGGALGRIWIPRAGAQPDAADAMVDAVRGAGTADEVPFGQASKASESVVSALVGALPRILAEGSEAAASTGLKAVDLINSAGDQFINPQLQRAYRRWVATQLAGGG